MIPISPFSGLDAICIEISGIKNRSDMGTICIEGLEGDGGQVVIRAHSELVKLHLLPEVAQKLVETAIPALEDDDAYNISMKTMTFQPDVNEPDDAPNKYTIELRLEKRASSPEDAIREIKKILNRPVEALESLLRRARIVRN